MDITNEQKVVVVVRGVTAGGKPASLEGWTLSYAVTDPAVAEIELGDPVKVKGLADGVTAVVVTATKDDQTLTGTSENLNVTSATVAGIVVEFGEVEAA